MSAKKPEAKSGSKPHTSHSAECENSMVIQHNDWKPKPFIRRFGVQPVDPGFIYMVQADGRYKIGRTQNPKSRIRSARTWLPKLEVIGIKPFWNSHEIEKYLHIGFARCWYGGEWFVPLDDGYKQELVDGFMEFYDDDINNNSVDFIYWFNSGGMAEFVREQFSQRRSIRKFLEQEALESRDMMG